VGWAVREHGWRVGWAWVGYALLCGLAPLGWLLAQNSPESCGVVPDEPGPEEPRATPSASLRDAVRTPAFWVYTLAATLFNFIFPALTLDSESLLVEHGLDGRQVNDLVLGVLMLAGLPANLSAGWLARRRPMGKLLGAGVATLAASLFLFPAVVSVPTALAYAVLLGVSGGGI